MALDVQTHVILANDIVDYSSIVMTGYPYYAIQSEPFIGLKLLCKDMKANTMAPAQRIQQINAFLSTPNQMGATPFHGTGCCLRETKYSIMKDGFWLITLPVPRSQLHTQITNVIRTISMLKHLAAFVQQGYVEINVSGRCPINGLENCLSGLHIPAPYSNFIEQPDGSPYKVGHVERINDNFILLRTRWRFNPTGNDLYDSISVVSQIICSIFH